MYSKRYGHISLLLLVFLTACSSQSPGEQATDSLKSVQSWVATVRMASTAWEQHTIPTVYARQTLHKAQAEIHKESNALTKAYGPAAATHLIKQIETTTQQMTIAIEAGDRSAVTHGIAQLASEQRAIHALVTHSTRTDL
jgi:hypothetical protein